MSVLLHELMTREGDGLERGTRSWTSSPGPRMMTELYLADEAAPHSATAADDRCTINEDGRLSRSPSAVLLAPQPQPHEKLRSRSRRE